MQKSLSTPKTLSKPWIEDEDAADLTEPQLPALRRAPDKEIEEPEVPDLSPSRPKESRLRRYGWPTLGAMAALVVGTVVVVVNQSKSNSKTEEGGAAYASRYHGIRTTVQVVSPEVRNMKFTVDEPAFVEAYEKTEIFAKVSGFVKKYNKDIGDKVNKGDVLCEIYDPELVEEHQQKVKQVDLDNQKVELAKQMVSLAQTKIKMATADLEKANADVKKYEADVTFWKSQWGRMSNMSKMERSIIDPQSLAEAHNKWDSAQSALDAAKAAVTAKVQAEKFAIVDKQKAGVAVAAALAQVQVSQAEEARFKAMVAYMAVTAPYNGVVTKRNVNTGDYVQAVAGDKTSSGRAPIFEVSRTDLVRIFVTVPQEFAREVEAGSPARVCVESLSGLEVPAKVARTSWSLYRSIDSLWAEIDLPTEKYGIRPGMYVHAKIFVERHDVRALPQEALTTEGNETYCYLFKDGRAAKTLVQRGSGDGNWVEVDKMKIGDPWVRISGKEQVILGNLEELSNGDKVEVAPAKS